MYCWPINCLFQTKLYNTGTYTPMPSCKRALNGDLARELLLGWRKKLKLMMQKPTDVKKKNQSRHILSPEGFGTSPCWGVNVTSNNPQKVLVYCNHQHRKTSRLMRPSNLSVTLKMNTLEQGLFWILAKPLVFFIDNSSFATIDISKEKIHFHLNCSHFCKSKQRYNAVCSMKMRKFFSITSLFSRL